MRTLIMILASLTLAAPVWGQSTAAGNTNETEINTDRTSGSGTEVEDEGQTQSTRSAKRLERNREAGNAETNKMSSPVNETTLDDTDKPGETGRTRGR